MFSIIYNPHSGGFSESALLQMQRTLTARGFECRLMPTEYAGHATKLAAEAVQQGYDGVISYGGDGTTYEVLNGMAGSEIELLLAPSGTGNDMIRTLGLPRDPLAALQMQLDSPPCRMDAVQVNDRWYMNVAGLGLDVLVLREYEKLRSRMFGSLAYKLAIFCALGKFRPESIRLSLDGGAYEPLKYTFLSFGNGRYIGGGMNCLPNADPFDGLIDVMTVKPLSKPFIVGILPLFFSGKHVNLSPVRNYRVKRLALDSDSPFWMQLDGELYETTHADVQIHPGILRMLLPR